MSLFALNSFFVAIAVVVLQFTSSLAALLSLG